MQRTSVFLFFILIVTILGVVFLPIPQKIPFLHSSSTSSPTPSLPDDTPHINPSPVYSDQFLLQTSAHHFTNLTTITAQNVQKLHEVTDLSESDKIALQDLVGFNADGNDIIFAQTLADGSQNIYDWNLSTGQKEKMANIRGQILGKDLQMDPFQGTTLFPTFKVIAVNTSKNWPPTITLFDQQTGQELGSVKGKRFRAIQFNQTGSMIVASNDEGLFLIDTNTEKLLRQIPCATKSYIAISADSTTLAAVDDTGLSQQKKKIFIDTWNLQNGKQLLHLPITFSGTMEPYSIIFNLSSNGNLLAYGTESNTNANDTVHIRNISTQREIYTRHIQGMLTSMFFVDHDHKLISFSGGEKWSTGQVEDIKNMREFPLPEVGNGIFAAAPFGDLFVGTEGDISSTETGKKIWRLPSKDRVDIDFFNPLGTLIFTSRWGEKNGQVSSYQIWEVE